MSLGGDVYPLGIKTGTPNDQTRQAILDAQAKYGKSVSGIDSMSSFADAGWDAVHILKQAMEKANSTDGTKVRDALETSTFVGGQVTSTYSPTQHRSTYDDYQAVVVVTEFNADGTIKKP
jgi:ABC-type branched-subunit amino acid transport system substrate-binding protein